MHRPRILVAGANYGRAYLSALAHAKNRFGTAGLLSSNSMRSIRAAAEFEVPLFHSIADLPPDIELVCAALGSRGSSIVLDLIRRRVPVLCEHPLTPNALDLALDQARTYSTSFHVNAHFPMLPSAREFFHLLSTSGEKPVFLDILATERSLYAALAILFTSLGSDQSFEVDSAGPGKPFVTVDAQFGGIPVLFRLQCEPSNAIPDGAAAYLVDYRITAGFRSGVLTLLSMGGPVVWTANYALPAAYAPSDGRQASPDELRAQRRDANLEAIETILNSRTPPEQHPAHLRALGKAWHAVANAIRR